MEISDDQITDAFSGYNFGDTGRSPRIRRRAIACAVMKAACGYSNGRTMSQILVALGLILTLEGKPTKAAMRWMYHEYHPTR